MSEVSTLPPRPPRKRDVIGTGIPHRSPVPVRLSSWFEGAARNFRVWLPPTLLCTGLLGFAGFFAAFLANDDYFKAEHISIVGRKRAPESELLARVESAAGEDDLTLWTSDKHILDAVLGQPQVAKASVVRDWPNGITVTVREHEAAGIVTHASGAFLVSPEGILFDRATPVDLANWSGPLATGFGADQPGIGKKLNEEGWRTVGKSMEAIRAANPELHARLSELNWEPNEGLTLVFDDGMRALAGWRPISEVGPELEAFIAAERTSALPVARVDLRTGDHLAWRPVRLPPPSKSKPAAIRSTSFTTPGN